MTRPFVRLAGGASTWQAGGGRRAVWSGREHVLRAFWQDQEGQGMVEYALVIVVIAIAIIFMLVLMKDQIINFFSNVGNNLT